MSVPMPTWSIPTASTSIEAYFYLYVILDVFSRYVVGWMVAHRESAMLAERFIHGLRERLPRSSFLVDALVEEIAAKHIAN